MMFSSRIFASPLAGTVMNFLCCSECMPAIFHGFPIVPLNKLGRTACPAFESCPALSFHQVGQSLVHHCPPGLDPMAGEEGWLCQSCLGVVQQFLGGGLHSLSSGADLLGAIFLCFRAGRAFRVGGLCSTGFFSCFFLMVVFASLCATLGSSGVMLLGVFYR